MCSKHITSIMSKQYKLIFFKSYDYYYQTMACEVCDVMDSPCE